MSTVFLRSPQEEYEIGLIINHLHSFYLYLLGLLGFKIQSAVIAVIISYNNYFSPRNWFSFKR
jgi:hypothetical protein